MDFITKYKRYLVLTLLDFTELYWDLFCTSRDAELGPTFFLFFSRLLLRTSLQTIASFASLNPFGIFAYPIPF